jgi:hypothetical protein
MELTKMRSRWWIGLFCILLAAPWAWSREAPRFFDPQRHLPIEKVRRGMKGYGLSIFYGTKIEKFNVKIVDVIPNFEPHRNAILIEATGQNLERTGVIQGMSGSPVYLTDPADGKDKIIGAVAFGWQFPCPGPAICGVQPIEEMMVINPAQTAKPMFAKSDPDFIRSALKLFTSTSGYQKPLKSFDRFALACGLAEPVQRNETEAAGNLSQSGLYPLATPVGVSGISPRAFGQLSTLLAPMNLNLVRTGAGSTGSALTSDPDPGKMVTAGVLAVPLALGDMNLAAIGTVTDATGDQVWGFGHAFFAQGPMELPIAPGIIHSIIPNQISSFKLGSPFKPVGTLFADQTTGVAGKIGPIPALIPLTVNVNFDGPIRTFHYQLALHEKLTPLITMMCINESVVSRKNLPEFHVVRYHGSVTFDRFGTVDISNISSDADLGSLLADVVEPINLMMNNDFQRVKFTAITMDVDIRPVSEKATILQAKLDKPYYRPGAEAKVEMIFTRLRGPEFSQAVTFTVPSDLPDGEYELSVGGMENGIMADRKSYPYLYKPNSAKDIFEMIKRIESFRGDKFYLALNTKEEGLGIRRYGLKELPGSKLQQLQEADPALTDKFSSSRSIEIPAKFVVSGQEQLKLVISRD